MLSAFNTVILDIFSVNNPIKRISALGNVGSVSFRLGRVEDCRVAMNRALHIMIMEYGDDSKEVLLHRAKMLTFQVTFCHSLVPLPLMEYSLSFY